MSFITSSERLSLPITLNKIINQLDNLQVDVVMENINTEQKGNIWIADADDYINVPSIRVKIDDKNYYHELRKFWNPYLSFIEENEESFTLKTSNSSKNWNGVLEYSTNTENWSEWNGEEINSSNDGKLYLRGTGNTEIANGGTFNLTENKRIKCKGNIETLLDYETVSSGEHPTMTEYCYDSLFMECVSLTEAPELPAITLVKDCYVNMFLNCTSLTKAPELPAVKLAEYCYDSIFMNCTSLTQMPKLPATKLANACYISMFCGCTSLIQVSELPATTLTEMCYNSMFYGCSSLTTAPNLPATTLAKECYAYMFHYCTSLTGQIHCPASTKDNTNKAILFHSGTAEVVFDL